MLETRVETQAELDLMIDWKMGCLLKGYSYNRD